MPDVAAESIGWQVSPFEFEVAVANLGIGVIGIVGYYRKSFNFALAATIIVTSFLWRAAFGHIRDITVSGDLAPDNAGPTLWTDILIPL